MTAIVLKALADGQLPPAKGTLYTTPAGKALIKEIRLVPTSGTARTGNLYVNRTGTSRRIDAKDFSLNPGQVRVWSGNVTMETGDLLEGDASAATEIDYVVSGMEDV